MLLFIGKSTHPTHNLVLKDGVYLCIKCGFKAQLRVNKLAKPCTGKRSTYGQGNMKKARKGTLSTVPSGTSSSLSHSFLLPSNSESLTAEEADALQSVVACMGNVSGPDTVISSSDSESVGCSSIQSDCLEPAACPVGDGAGAGLSESD